MSSSVSIHGADLDTINEVDNRGEGSGKGLGADFISIAAGKTVYGGFRLKRMCPAPFRSEPRSDFPTQLLACSVPTIDMAAFGDVHVSS
jgi:hypothetical protein